MRKRSVVLVAGAVAAALLGVGCGSDSTAAAPPLAKAAFIKKATAICTAGGDKVFSEYLPALRKAERNGEPTREAELPLIPTILVPALEGVIEEVHELGMPRGDEDRINAIFDTLQEVVDEAKTETDRFLHQQVHFEHPFHKAEKLADEYGIPACGQP